MATIKAYRTPKVSGRVKQVIGLLIESTSQDVFIGELCYIYSKNREPLPCQVVGFKEKSVLLMSLADISHIAPGAEVYPTGEVHQVAVSEALCGRVLDAFGRPIDGKGSIIPEKFYPVVSQPPTPLSRKPITRALPTGIKALDSFCTLGQGQRVGIFSKPGVGKSTLMGMIAKMAEADINVIALIGERGREVRDFIDRELGQEGLARSVVVVATADQAALLRSKGANVAMAIAEYFRDLKKHVVFMMDSVSRYAMALREIGLAIGEPPTSRGYTPSVFAQLPRLLERAGNSNNGSITGVYTILCEEEEVNDPIPDYMRSLLDGHIQLSADLAMANHFPPIDILRSLSRIMPHVTDSKHQQKANRIRALLHSYHEVEELINLGAYVKGSNPKSDEAISNISAIKKFLQQGRDERVSFKNSMEMI